LTPNPGQYPDVAVEQTVHAPELIVEPAAHVNEHAVKDVCPVKLEYVPRGHVILVVPPGQKLPAGHIIGAVDRPTAL
jgi:hypothetical protein